MPWFRKALDTGAWRRCKSANKDRDCQGAALKPNVLLSVGLRVDGGELLHAAKDQGHAAVECGADC